MEKRKVWFVTGASKGLGQVLVKRLLQEGYAVVGSSRNRDALVESIGTHPNFLPLEMALTDEKSVEKAFNTILKTFGKVDVVVNNAGYGQLGSIEEATDKEARENFDVNVFGLLNVTRAASGIMRDQRSGHVINISSVGGFFGGFSGWGIYCATKFAVAGLTESLDLDLRSIGARATVVYPGYFRTSFLEKDSLRSAQKTIVAYTAAQKSKALHLESINGSQLGAPDKAARAIISAAEKADPPLHLFLGSDAYKTAKEKLKEMERALEESKALTYSTDY